MSYLTHRRQFFSGPLALIGGFKLLDLDEVGVARTPLAHAGGMGLRLVALTEGKGAAPVVKNHKTLGLSSRDLVASNGLATAP